MQIMTKQLALLTVVTMSAIGLTACNTVAGVGEDVEAAGDKLESSAQENNTYN